MKQIMKTCSTCDGKGMVKIDTLGDLHTLDTQSVWCEDGQEFLELKEEYCPECFGLGEIDITEDVEDDIEYFKRKEKQNEN